MQSVVENLGGLLRKIKVTVPQERLKNEVDRRIKKLASTAKMKGFRRGKVPADIIKLQEGTRVFQEVLQDVLEETWQQAIEKQDFIPASVPNIELTNIKEDAPFTYEASFEIFPQIKIDIANVTLEKPIGKIKDQDVAEAIEKLRKQNVNWQEVDRPAQVGDLVLIDFIGTIEGAPFEGGTAQGFKLELGTRSMVPGFEDPIYGVTPGSTVEANITFPADYHAKQYADKAAKFVITVNKVMASELPELNNAFAASLGVSDGTLEGLNSEVRQNLEAQFIDRVRDHVKIQLVSTLEKNQIELPRVAVDEEYSRLKKRLQKQVSSPEEPVELPQAIEESLYKQARRNMLLGLFLSQWIAEHQMTVDPARVHAKIEQAASRYSRPQDVIGWYYANKKGLKEMEAMVLEEQVVDKILELAVVTEKEFSFDELMKVETQQGE